MCDIIKLIDGSFYTLASFALNQKKRKIIKIIHQLFGIYRNNSNDKQQTPLPPPVTTTTIPTSEERIIYVKI